MKPIRAVRKYTLYTLMAVLLSVSAATFVVLSNIHQEAMSQANTALRQRMKVFRELLRVKGSDYRIENGKLFAGSYVINANSEVPDKLAAMFGGAFTVFMGDQRIATSIKREDGARIIGTRLIGPPHDAVFGRGEAYSGTADILGVPYITYYEPLKDQDGAIIGALYSGLKSEEYLAHFERLSYAAAGILFGIAGIISALYYLLLRQMRIAEQQSANELAFLQTLMDAIPLPVFYKDENGKMLGCNAAYESLVGMWRQDVVGKTTHDIIADKELAVTHEKIDRQLLAAEPGLKHSSEAKMPTPNGISRDVQIIKTCFQDVSGRNAGIVGSVLDITERRQLGRMMLETEKMLLAGRLAAGMAHELNNPIGSILQNIQNMQRRLSEELPANQKAASDIGLDMQQMQTYLEQRGINEMLEYISRAGTQAADIVNNMLAFCGRGADQHQAVPLQEVTDVALEQVCSEYGPEKLQGLNIIREYDQDMPAADMDRLEMERAVVNLIRNAVQAVQERICNNNARIILRTVKSGKLAIIEVEDNGPGIRPEIRGKVFEPFFSTRDVGEGRGMGLAVAYALVVQNHNGQISLGDASDGGAKVCIKLPLSVETA